MLTASRVFVALAGALAAVIGAALLFDPIGFEASAGIALPADPRLLSELRAPGAALLGGGAFMIVGAVYRRYTRPAIAFGSAIYLAYGLGRLVGFAFDGLPGETLVFVAILELAIGLAGLTLLGMSTRDADAEKLQSVAYR